MDRIPTIIFRAVNPASINTIPNSIKLIPKRMDTVIVPEIGNIIKINPKIIASIPDILFDSIFFLLKFVKFTFSSENYD